MAHLSDKQLREYLIQFGEDVGPVNATTRYVYEKRYNELKSKNMLKPISQSTPLNNFNGLSSQKTKTNNSSKHTINANNKTSCSPIQYLSLHSYNKPNVNDSLSSTNSENNSNSLQRIYNRTRSTLSDYLGRSHESNCVDISDFDSSDDENNLYHRLRKNFKKADRNHDSSPHKYKSSNLNSIFKSEQFPNVLLGIFIIFILGLFFGYLIINNRQSSSEIDMALKRFICQHENQQDCIEVNQISRIKICLARMFDILSEKAGEVLCDGFNSEDNNQYRSLVAYDKSRDLLNEKLQKMGKAQLTTEEWYQLMSLILRLDKLYINVYDDNYQLLNFADKPESVTYLESRTPKCTLLCRMRLIIGRTILWLTFICKYLALLMICVGIIYAINWWRLKRRADYQKEIAEYRDIIQTITSLLQEQLSNSERNGSEPFLSVLRIKSIIQQTHPKARNAAYWNKVKTFMYNNEMSIELKDRIVEGEVLQWRGKPSWQGSGERFICGNSKFHSIINNKQTPSTISLSQSPISSHKLPLASTTASTSSHYHNNSFLSNLFYHDLFMSKTNRYPNNNHNIFAQNPSSTTSTSTIFSNLYRVPPLGYLRNPNDRFNYLFKHTI